MDLKLRLYKPEPVRVLEQVLALVWELALVLEQVRVPV